MKRIILVAAALAAILIVLPVGAAKPVPSGTIAVDQASLSLGDVVTFTVTTSNHDPQLRIQLICYQADFDGDGYPDMVYGADQPADTGFLLGSVGSTWKDRRGSADCHANLYSNQGGYVFYAGLDFVAGG
jgi:hypothetical protein